MVCYFYPFLQEHLKTEGFYWGKIPSRRRSKPHMRKKNKQAIVSQALRSIFVWLVFTKHGANSISGSQLEGKTTHWHWRWYLQSNVISVEGRVQPRPLIWRLTVRIAFSFTRLSQLTLWSPGYTLYVLVVTILQEQNSMLKRERQNLKVNFVSEMWETDITLSVEYFHSSTLSMLFLLVNFGLAPTEKNKCTSKQTLLSRKIFHNLSQIRLSLSGLSCSHSGQHQSHDVQCGSVRQPSKQSE